MSNKRLRTKDFIKKERDVGILYAAYRKKKVMLSKKRLIHDKLHYLRTLFSHQEGAINSEAFMRDIYSELKKIDVSMSTREIKSINQDIIIKICDTINAEVKLIDACGAKEFLRIRQRCLDILLGAECAANIENEIIKIQVLRVKLLSIVQKLLPNSEDSGSIKDSFSVKGM